jgi:hypothetical protein
MKNCLPFLMTVPSPLFLDGFKIQISQILSHFVDMQISINLFRRYFTAQYRVSTPFLAFAVPDGLVAAILFDFQIFDPDAGAFQLAANADFFGQMSRLDQWA